MAEPRNRGTTRCIVCGGRLGFHPLRTKEGSICGRVDEKHANFLLDRKMEKSFCRIARRRKNTVLMVFILVALFVWVLWLIVFIANFNTIFVGIVAVATVAGSAFLWMEFRTAMLGDRMETLCRQVDLGRPGSYDARADASAGRTYEDPMKAYAEPEPARPAPQGLLMYEDMAPTSAEATRRLPVPEVGMPGAPQRIMAPGEWEDMMPVGGEGMAAPSPPPPPPPPAEAAPAEGPLPAAWTPPPPPPAARADFPPPPPVAVPPRPIEELPEEGARRRVVPPPPLKAKAPPVSALKAPPQKPPAAPPPPQPAYQQPQYQQPPYQQPSYQQPQPPYQPQPNYQQPQPAYQQPQPAYQQPQPAYQQPQPAYQQPQPAYQQPQPTYQPQPARPAQPAYQQPQAPAQRPTYAPQPQPAPAYPPQYYQQPPPQQPQQQRPKKVEEEPVVSWEEY
jgi:hypothetical protein